MWGDVLVRIFVQRRASNSFFEYSTTALSVLKRDKTSRKGNAVADVASMCETSLIVKHAQRDRSKSTLPYRAKSVLE